jgi:hypothetical protein
VEQSLYKLEANKQKELNTVEAEFLVMPVAHQLPLADFFIFNPSFLMLPNLLNGNTSIPFP